MAVSDEILLRDVNLVEVSIPPASAKVSVLERFSRPQASPDRKVQARAGSGYSVFLFCC